MAEFHVVAGVKHFLLLEIAPTICSKDQTDPNCPLDLTKGTYICKVEFFDQPWRRLAKNIVKNNCTVSQEFLAKEPEQQPNKNNHREINDEFFAELESQMVPETKVVNEGYYAYQNEIEEPAKTPTFKQGGNNFYQFILPKEDTVNEGVVQSKDEQDQTDWIKYSDGSLYNAERGRMKRDSDINSSTDEKKHKNKNEASDSDSDSDSSDENDKYKRKKKADDSDSDSSSDESKNEKKREHSSKPSSSESSKSSKSSDSSDEHQKDEENEVPEVEIKRKRSTRDLESLTEDEFKLLKKFAKKAAGKSGWDNAKTNIVRVDKVKIDGLYYSMRVKIEKTPLVKVCSLLVHTEDDMSNPILVKSTCNNKRVRRGIPGGVVNIEKDDPQVKKFLKDGLLHLDFYSPHSNRYKIKEIISASSQVVSGQLVRIKARLVLSDCGKSTDSNIDECGELEGGSSKVCDFKIWNQPWKTNGRQTKIICEGDDKTYSFRVRRSLGGSGPPLVGGITETSPNDPQVKEYLNDGLLHLDSQSSHRNRYKIQDILSASSQVVSGSLWRVKAKLILSNCIKGDNTEIEKCGELQGAPSKICNFVIWDQPWLDNGRKTNITCDDEDKSYYFVRGKRSLRDESGPPLVGGITEQSGDNPEVEEFLKEGLFHLDSQSSHMNRYKIQDILSVSSQVVSGSLWRVKAKLVLSDCVKGDNTEIDECGELQGAQSKICNFVIWNQPWLENGRKTNITCDDDDKSYYLVRGKRSLQDLDDDKSLDEDLNYLFGLFVKTYRKTYLNAMEYNLRLRVFTNNIEIIRLLNKFEQGSATYGLSKYADLTQEEFSMMHGLRRGLQNGNELPFPSAEIPDIEIPTEFDWRKKNAVTEVKDQASCGSCWAFSTTGNVEGQYAIKYNKLQTFSEQELVDCDSLDNGCNGGLMDNAYRAIEKLGGLESEKDYPYEAEDEKCHFNKSKTIVRVSGALNISHDEGDMAKWLVQNGPIAIAINANAMQFYMGGVSWPLKFLCNPNNLDHGVLIVGYGVDSFPRFNKTLPYWIVKNSWGKSWGEQGYYRVYRGKGVCGLNQTPSSAIVA